MISPPKGFKAERHQTTGAMVAWDDLIKKFVVLDCHGDEHAFRRNLDEARAIAASLPGEPWAPPEPQVSISPRSLKAKAQASHQPMPSNTDVGKE
jgi:hypothetical protein